MDHPRKSNRGVVTERQFVSLLESRFAAEGFLTRSEIGVGHGVADLVLIHPKMLSKRRVRLRSSYLQTFPLLKEGYFKVLENLPDPPGKISLTKLLNKTHISRQFLKYDILRTLLDEGYIRQVSGTYYFKVNGWMPLAKEVIAVEAKLRDWKRGIVQANRYRAFADRVFIAVPEQIVRLIDHSLLRRLRIGLISFDPVTQKKSVIVPSPFVRPKARSMRNLAVEHFWKPEKFKNGDLAFGSLQGTSPASLLESRQIA